jgi:hypothetical protein
MAHKYLKSLITGVVLPYVEASLLSKNVRVMTPEECAEYEASLPGGVKTPAAAPEPTPAPEPVAVAAIETPPTEVKKGVTVTRDISEGEPNVDEVIAALEVD